MHLRYDLKNKLDFQKFSLQGVFFLNKEDCVFSFYLSDFAASFNITRQNDIWEMNYSLSEVSKSNNNGDSYYKHIAYLQDPRFKELFFIKEIAESPSGNVVRNNPTEIINTIVVIVKALSKLNKLTFAI